MTISSRHILADARISPRFILLAVIVLQILLYVVVEVFSFPAQVVSQTTVRFLVLAVLCWVAWELTDRHEVIARWLTVATLILGIGAASLSLGPAAMAWMAVVPMVTAALISVPAATAAVFAASGLVLTLIYAGRGDMMTGGIAIALTWVSFLLTAVVIHSFTERLIWLVGYFEEAHRQLEEARDHRTAYEQALEDLRHANRQMVLMNQRVTGLRKVAEEAQEAKTRFVARVSHEFRTPLNMIIGLVDLMVTSPEIYDVSLSPRMREALRVVHRNCEHLSDMVDDVLDLTRIEMDRMALHKERVDLAEVIQSATDAVSPLLEDKRLELRTMIPLEMPEVYCDRTRMEQVILNLVSNAARYTDEGGITVQVVSDQQRVRVSVADTGSGIRPEDVERIFEPFCQGTAELWRDRGGSGLGLSISKQFVELHGGRMWVESELGVGTTFTFDLPISPALGPIARPGHQIREDWIWQRHARPDFPDTHYVPRFLVYDEIGDLEPFLASWADKFDFVSLPDLTQTVTTLEDEPAHAVLINSSDLQRLWEEIGVIRQVATGTPVIGCSITRNDGRARSLGVRGHLVKPVQRQDFASALSAVGSDVRRVLVVDDDLDALKLFGDMLRTCEASLEIVQAADGRAALDALQRAAPDLMFLDLVMPEMDGWQVLEAMIEETDVPQVPTYLISAQDPRDQLMRSGFLLVSAEDGLPLNSVIELSLKTVELAQGRELPSAP